MPGAADTVAAFTEAALAAGTRRLVLLSGRGEEEAQNAERALQASAADWTIVRCSWFSQNFSESYFVEPLLAGELALPADSVGEPFVDAADVAAAALTDDGHVGKLYVPITLEELMAGLGAQGSRRRHRAARVPVRRGARRPQRARERRRPAGARSPGA